MSSATTTQPETLELFQEHERAKITVYVHGEMVYWWAGKTKLRELPEEDFKQVTVRSLDPRPHEGLEVTSRGGKLHSAHVHSTHSFRGPALDGALSVTCTVPTEDELLMERGWTARASRYRFW